MKKQNKKMKGWHKALIIVGSIIGGIFSLALVAILTMNVVKFAIYDEYFSIRTTVCTNNGLDSNYVSQGTAITDDGVYLITSGYMSDKTASRIYITEIATNKYKYVELYKDENKPATYHFGGVAVNKDKIYLASNDKVFSILLSDALSKDSLIIQEEFEANNQASFVFCDANHIYVGEFYDGGKYVTENKITYNNATYNAIVEKYKIGDYSKPLSVIAIRNKVQGFALDENGNILLSCSYGLSSSAFYYYKNDSLINTETTYFDNVPLYVLESHDLFVKAPAMSEDLDYLNGKFYTNFESACNKYLYGKLFFNADKIVALDFTKLIK